METVRELIRSYHDMMDNGSDPRVNSWPMMSGPLPTLVICALYAYGAKVTGPNLMRNRKPVQLRGVLVAYNLAQTLFSAWIFYECLASGWLGRYSFRCQPVDYSNDPVALRMTRTCWWYYVSKFTEFFDTLFFVLRKKNDHISTLHVIHHGCMPMSVWLGVKFAPGGHSTFFALLNTFVHVVMYFYYMVSAMGPRYQRYVWWKKYLTGLQMAQFVAILVHQLQLLFVDCDYPKAFVLWIALHGVMFLVLFSDFYRYSYRGTKKGTKPTAVTCMPVVRYDKNEDGEDRRLENVEGYVNGYTKSYKDCYSYGVKNGFVSGSRKDK